MPSVLIFISQLIFLSLLAMGLHYASPRIGLAPLLFMLAGIIGLLNVIELNALVIILPNNIVLRPGGHIFIPVALLILLMIYVVQGTRPAQVAVLGVMGVNSLVFVTLLFLSLYVQFAGSDTQVSGLFTNEAAFNQQFIRGMVASLIAYIADMLILIVVFQGITNYLKWIPKLLVAGIALIVALWIDSIVYNIGAFVGTSNFNLSIPSDILVKTGAGLILTPIIGWYITRIAPHLPNFAGVEKRPTLGILFHSNAGDAQIETLESELRISRTVYNQLTQHIEEIFWLLDIEAHRFIYISPAYERITNYSVEPLYQNINNLLQIIHQDDRQYTEGNILGFLTEERDTEFRIVRPNKMVRWLRARSFPIKDEVGKIIRYAGIAEDITERKTLSENAFELAIARERMQVLHDFIRDASHDLKTPISAMILKIGLLDRIDDEQRRKEIRSELRGRALYLSDFITDLFTLSRIEAADEVEMESINLNQIVEGVIQDTRLLAEHKQLEFTSTLTQDQTNFMGNADQIHRVVSNLISNAIRYTSHGSIQISTLIDSTQVILHVADTGIGIPQESLGRVFDRFFRTNSAINIQEGTGLGLAISKAIVDKHHGQLTVKSVEGEGATFSLILPRIQPKPSQSSLNMNRRTQEIRTL
ncbi:MAG: ATP-binding protein [Phototrophicaceae bacterium]